MSDEIWVMKVKYEKNVDDGISYFTDKDDLAAAVFDAEYTLGGTVQVYKCVPVNHEVYFSKASINIDEINS